MYEVCVNTEYLKHLKSLMCMCVWCDSVDNTSDSDSQNDIHIDIHAGASFGTKAEEALKFYRYGKPIIIMSQFFSTMHEVFIAL